MILPDVNVLVYTHRADVQDHERYMTWLTGVVQSNAAFGLAEVVLSAFIRIVTNPKIFTIPTPTQVAIDATNKLKTRSNCRLVVPGSRHWEIFTDLCAKGGVRGARVTDAYLAALAIESGCEWITADRDFARFAGLNWRHPLS